MKKSITHSLLLVCFISSFSVFAQHTWTPRAELPGGQAVARHHPVTFALDGYGYLLTGTTGSSLVNNDMFRYDPNNDSWHQMANFPGPSRSFSIAATYNGKAYMGFGLTASGTSFSMLNDLWVFDPADSSWTELTSCPCVGRRHPTFTINQQEGKLYMGKGDNAQFNMTDWWEYDIASDSWTQRLNFPGTNRHHPFHFSIGDKVFSGLGHGQGIYADWYEYDPFDNTWQQKASAPGQRVAGTQFDYQGYGFVLSGDGTNHLPTNPSVFWRYDPNNDSWMTLPPHPGWSRWAPGSFVIDGVVYFMCGENGQNDVLMRDVWAFDLANLLSTEKEELRNKLSVYPNPAATSIKISSDIDFSNGTIEIQTMEGRTVVKGSYQPEISLENLSNGAYLLRITTENGEVITEKFIKNG